MMPEAKRSFADGIPEREFGNEGKDSILDAHDEGDTPVGVKIPGAEAPAGPQCLERPQDADGRE